MKKNRIILFSLFISLVATSFVYAEDTLSIGKYVMNDGVMNIIFEVKQINNGRYFIEGNGNNKAGAMCMMNGIGILNGNNFQLGYNCTINLKPMNGDIEITDLNKCIPCDSGAYISGVYKKQ